MKMLMKCIGAELVRNSNPSGSLNGLVKLVLVPKEIVKQKIGITDMLGGGLENVINKTNQFKQFKTEVFVSQEFFIKECKNTLYHNILIDISIDTPSWVIAKQKKE